MPELPEVETIKNQLNREIVGKTIDEVVYDTPKMLKPAPEVLIKNSIGKKIVEIDRRAKLILVKLNDQSAIAVHLKLNGRLLHRLRKDPVDLYTHVTVKFRGEDELRFADSRKFGFMQYLKDPQEVTKIVGHYGFEPLNNLSRDQFHQIVTASGRKIKDILMDQSVIAGVGNIYVNDALWLAYIHPETKGNNLTQKEMDILFDALESVLKEALKEGGASDQWYRQIHGEIGHYQEHFKVYGRKDEPCLRHPHQKIVYLKVSQRGTFICPKCQIKKT